MKKYIPLIAALLLSGNAHAQSNSYTTPEYSGPSAALESRGMGTPRALPSMPLREQPTITRSNDTGYDRAIDARGRQISREMDRRRDDIIRANERYIIKMNE